MKISLRWLQDFLDVSESPETVGERLTMVGLAVDGIEERGDDTIFELDVTANRGDCLSHLGVARELAAVYDTEVRFPETTVGEGSTMIGDSFSISIADPDLCHRYCGRYVTGVTIGPSPDWLIDRLEAVGIRPINNVADITNYVLMELGHPQHAFDADTIEESRIVVRRAAGGETIRTLDDAERTLDESMLVIADGRRAVALAGIMGGLETEISDQTTNVLIESAWFDPVSVRKTGRAVNLGTEASHRFERVADPGMAPIALDRTARLISRIAGGQVHRGVIDLYPTPLDPRRLLLRRARVGRYLGGDVPDGEIERILSRLGFGPVPTGAGWSVAAPGYRHDIVREEDLLEEVARHYGYDRFPAKMPQWTGQGRHLNGDAEESTVRDALVGLGYSEACTIAFSNVELENRFAPGIEPTSIRNPLSEDEPVLRTSLLPSVLKAVQWNLHRGIRDVSLYEIAKVYPRSGEYRQFVMATTGASRPRTVHSEAVETSFYSVRGEVESLLDRFSVSLKPSTEGLPDHYHRGRSTRLGAVAVVGELNAGHGEIFKLRQKVYVAEIAIEALLQDGLKNIAALPIPKYPPIRRDLSLLVGREIRYAEILQAVERAGISELVRVTPFDKLDKGPFPASCYSLAVALVFQSSERTLTDIDVQAFEARLLGELRAIGVELRG